MGKSISKLEENSNFLFTDKYWDYLDLMKKADCSSEELQMKSKCLIEYSKLPVMEKANVVKNDMTFLEFFTGGGVVCSDESGRKLYNGINREITHAVMATMSSIKQNVELPSEYLDEIEGPETLPTVKDRVSYDMSQVFPDIKKMFFLGKSEEFHKRMTKIFDDSEDIERFSDIVDDSVYRKDESRNREYQDYITEIVKKSKEMDFEEKSQKLS